MDLGQDWGALNRILYPRKKARGSSVSENVFVAHHSDRTLRVVGDRDELLFSTGNPVTEALTAIGSDRKAVAIDVAEMDRILNASLRTDGGIYDQVREIRETLTCTKGKIPALDEHFILNAIRTWWGKMLPSHFGIYLHLESSNVSEAKTLLLIFRKGELAEFDVPDLSATSEERRADLSEVVKILRERHGIPVQGFSVDRADFTAWSESKNTSTTWKNISKALRQDRLQLVPFRFGIAAMMGSRGIFGA